jgi:membrane fusion protein (multidrug efflux system)
LARFELRAPFDGIVGTRHVSVGTYVPAGQPIVTFLAKQQQLEMTVFTPPEVAHEQKVGTELSNGTISAVDGLINSATGLQPIQITLKDTAVPPGTSLPVELPLGAPLPRIILPAHAVIASPAGSAVYVIPAKQPVESPRTVVLKSVHIEENRGDTVVIRDGLSDGDEVVTFGAFKLNPGPMTRVITTAEGLPPIATNDLPNN